MIQENTIQAIDLNGNVSIELQGENALIMAGTYGSPGQIQVLDAENAEKVLIEAENADIFLADFEKEILDPSNLASLQEMATFLLENQHLPDFPSPVALRPGQRVKQFMVKLIRMQEHLVLKTAELEAKIQELEPVG